VRPAGPACHRGTRSCFDPAPEGGPAGEPEGAGAVDAAGASPEPPTEIAVTYPEPEGFAWLETLWSTIADRRDRRPPGSYTASLLDGGVDAIGRKVTEEATEVLIAAKDDAVAEAAGADRAPTSTALADETADLLYHALVLLAERGLSPGVALEVLRARHAD